MPGRRILSIVSVACLVVVAAPATPAAAVAARPLRVVPGVDITPPGGFTSPGWRVNNRGQVLLHGGGSSVWQHGRWTDVGTLGGSYAWVAALSEAGDVVGGSDLPGDTEGHAFRWRNGRMTDLGTLGGRSSSAEAAAPNGNVAGNSTLPDGSLHVFHWRAGVMTDTGIPGDILGKTLVNARGQVAANYTDDDFTGTRTYFWDGRTFVDIGSLGGRWVNVMDMNDRGEIVGSASTPEGYYHGFLYSRGRFIDLGTLGGSESEAWDINNRGQITGLARTFEGPDRAFRWENGVMTALGSAGEQSAGTAINEHGDVVGTRENEGVVWRGRQTIKLGTPFPGTATGYDINDSGLVVGQSYNNENWTEFVTVWYTGR